MNDRLERSLIVLSALLGAALALEWHAGALSPIDREAVGSRGPLISTPTAAAPESSGTRELDAAVSEAQARPLFNPTRRAAAGSENANSGMPILHARLAGTVIGASGAEALIVDRQRNLALEVHEGETFDGWTVERIHGDWALLSSGPQQARIELSGEYRVAMVAASLPAPGVLARRSAKMSWGDRH